MFCITRRSVFKTAILFVVLASFFITTIFVGAPASAQASLVVDDCGKKIDPADLGKDEWHCLPAWRWGGSGGLTTTLTPHAGWNVWGWIVDLVNWLTSWPFLAARYVWHFGLWIIKLTLVAEDIESIFKSIAPGDKIEIWQSLFEFIGLQPGGQHNTPPGSKNQPSSTSFMGDATLWISLYAITAIYAIWLIVKPRTGMMEYHEVSKWFTGISTFLATAIPLSIILLMAVNYNNTYTPPNNKSNSWMGFSYQAIKSMTVDRARSSITGIVTNGGKNLKPAAGGSRAESTCSAYIEQLTNKFNPPGSTKLLATVEIPKAVSKLWEGAYMNLLGTAQFGVPKVGQRAMCFVMENARGLSAETQMKLLHEAMEGPPHPDMDITAPKSFRPNGSKEQQVLLVLAAACGFNKISADGYRTITDKSKDVYGPQTKAEEWKSHKFPHGATGTAPVVDAWLYKEWTGIQNHGWRTNATPDNTLSANACSAWMFPSSYSWDKSMQGGITDDMKVGLGAKWMQDHANINLGDAQKWRKQLPLQVKAQKVDAGNQPTQEEINETVKVLATISGNGEGGISGTVLLGFAALVISLIYFKALTGLALGTVIANFILAILLYMLPLLLFIIAIPIEPARNLRRRLIRLYIAAILSYTVFYCLLLLMVVLITAMQEWVDSYFKDHAISPGFVLGHGFASTLGSWPYYMLTALVPYVALKVVNGLLKQFGMSDIMSMRGAAQFSAGLPAAGLRLPTAKEFVSTLNKDIFKPAYTAGKMIAKVGAGAVSKIGGAKKHGLPKAKNFFNKAKRKDTWANAFKSIVNSSKEKVKKGWERKTSEAWSGDWRDKAKDRFSEGWNSAKDKFSDSQKVNLPWSDNPIIGRDPAMEAINRQKKEIQEALNGTDSSNTKIKELELKILQQVATNTHKTATEGGSLRSSGPIPVVVTQMPSTGSKRPSGNLWGEGDGGGEDG